MTAIELVTAGGVILDNVVTPDGRLSRAMMGGNAVHSAIGARLWSPSVGIVGSLCSNYPDDLLDRLERAGVDLGGLVRFPEPVEQSEWFFYRGDGSRDDHLYASTGEADAAGIAGRWLSREAIASWKDHIRRKPGAGLTFGAFRKAHPVGPGFMPPDWGAPKGIHLAPESAAAQRDFCTAVRRSGTVVTLDPGGQVGRLGDAGLDALLGLVDAFLPSEKELYAVTGEGHSAAMLLRIAGRGSATVAVKVGARGCLVVPAQATDVVHVPAFKVDALDPTGAGDAFCGGFLAGLVETGDPVRAACYGTVSASFAVERFGALPSSPPSPAEAETRLKAVSDAVRILQKDHAG